MDTEEKNQRACRAMGADFLLQWGNRKRLIRGMRLKDPAISQRSTGLIRRKITARSADRFAAANTEKGVSLLQSNRLTRNSEAATLIRSGSNENHRKSSPPEKEDRYYTTRGSMVGVDDNGKVSLDGNRGEEKGFVWPKLFISLSNKEKEEDFMAMKGCKPPQRPKKRAKIIQRSLLLVSPGAWLSDMCRERYEVREKKGSKKRARGLKAMGSMESDSE